MSVVILGGGIIGLSIAYCTSLAQPDRKIIIVDSEKSLFLSASGFSGGYVVRDWFSPNVLPLSELSYRLHRELAESNDGRKEWGYSESNAYSLVMDDIDADGKGKTVRGEDWLLTGTSRAEVAKRYTSVVGRSTGVHETKDELLRPDGSPVWANVPVGGRLEKISSPSGCAQVEPRQLCEWLLKKCRNQRVEISLDTNAFGLKRDASGLVAGLYVEKGPAATGQVKRGVIPCRDIVIAAGCWTPRVFQTLVKRKMEIGIKGLAGYSIVVRSPRYSRPIMEVTEERRQVEISHSIFYPPGSSWTYSPEAMARMTRSGKPEIFVAGLNSETMVLPRLAGETKLLMDSSQMEDLRKTALAIAGKTSNGEPQDDLEVVREALCFRPCSESGVPIISRVKDIAMTSSGGGLYVASGHGPWGITLSLGTGMVMSELLQGAAPSVCIDAFTLPEADFALQARL